MNAAATPPAVRAPIDLAVIGFQQGDRVGAADRIDALIA